MTPYYQDNHIRIFNKDCRSMSELPDENVQMVCTSPPFWGLRKYSGEQELIWGNKDCEHQWIDSSVRMQTGGVSNKQQSNRGITGNGWQRDSGFCSLCGAWKGAYGLEPTPEMYIEHTIEILREIRRVLRNDGVVFWDIGDSYAANRSYQVTDTKWRDVGNTKGSQVPEGLKPKDLCLIPFRVAIAAQEDGWWVRSVIIWSKPNPMPESVTDRPTESHEYILLLTKSAKYYWDADAVREPNTDPQRTNFVSGARTHGLNLDRNDNDLGERSKNFVANGRNIRTVWEFPTQPYPEAHFAVFPEKLPELCIKAATPEVGCCRKCGAPWARVLEKKPSDFNIRVRDAKAGRATPEEGYKATQEEIDNYPGNHPDPGYRQTLGWQPTCKCNADKVPSIILDPFSGAGTTLWVAKKLGRQAVGYEISEEYCQLAVERCRQQVLI